MNSERILLIGPRGAGKSAVGPVLAALLRLPFHDLDREVEKGGRTIEEWMRMGRFREEEVLVLQRFLGKRRGVLAAGGGCVLWHGFAKAALAWRVVWLDAPHDVLARRLAADPVRRPALTRLSPAEEIEKIATERLPLYHAAASFRIDAGFQPPHRIAKEILARLEKDLPDHEENAD